MELLITYHNGDSEIISFEHANTLDEIEYAIMSKINVTLKGHDDGDRLTYIPLTAIRSIRPISVD